MENGVGNVLVVSTPDLSMDGLLGAGGDFGVLENKEVLSVKYWTYKKW